MYVRVEVWVHVVWVPERTRVLAWVHVVWVLARVHVWVLAQHHVESEAEATEAEATEAHHQLEMLLSLTLGCLVHHQPREGSWLKHRERQVIKGGWPLADTMSRKHLSENMAAACGCELQWRRNYSRLIA